MKNHTIYTLFLLAFVAILFQSNSQGRANVAGTGNTGAPGDASTTCITCHGTSSAIQVDLGIEASDEAGDAVTTTYTPGQSYTIKVSLNATVGSPSAYGFQIVSLNGELNVDADAINDWVNPSDNARIINIASTNRTYVEHKGPSTTNEFTVEWKAPETGSGTVTFYACGNGVNWNGSTSGDNAACNQFTLEEGVVSFTSNRIADLQLLAAPNPAQNYIQLFTKLSKGEEFNIGIYTFNGQLVKQQVNFLAAGEQQTQLDLSQLNQGIYIIRIQNEKETASLKFVKQ